MKKILRVKISLILTIVLIIAASGFTWALLRLPEMTAGPQTEEERYMEAVMDSMVAEEEEILPLVSLEPGAPYATYNVSGEVLLLTFHRFPDSYPDGADISLEWGDVWTFSGGELADWYTDNGEKVTEWPTRLRQLLGLTPDNAATHITAMWVAPENVVRPANVQDIGDITMLAALDENTDEAFQEWYDANILWSYFQSAYPWTRLGYTYDWAENCDEYGLSEFLIAKGSEIEVAYTVTLDEFISMLDGGSWVPQDAVALDNGE